MIAVARCVLLLTVTAAILAGTAILYASPVTAFDIISACIGGYIGSTLAMRE